MDKSKSKNENENDELDVLCKHCKEAAIARSEHYQRALLKIYYECVDNNRARGVAAGALLAAPLITPEHGPFKGTATGRSAEKDPAPYLSVRSSERELGTDRPSSLFNLNFKELEERTMAQMCQIEGLHIYVLDGRRVSCGLCGAEPGPGEHNAITAESFKAIFGKEPHK